jgi:uncharacterized protein YegL
VKGKIMSEQTEYVGFGASEFADNAEPRVACVLLLDVSGSMSGSPISELNDGLGILKYTIYADTLASKRAEIAIVTFGGVVNTVQDFVTVDRFNPPTLSPYGDTPMGGAITTGIELINSRKLTYKTNGVSYYKPWIFLITDGGPTDAWQAAANQVRDGEKVGSFVFFAIGVEAANMDVLSQISARPPVKLRGLDFRSLFLWLSQSMKAVSMSSPGDKVNLPPLDWTQI